MMVSERWGGNEIAPPFGIFSSDLSCTYLVQKSLYKQKYVASSKLSWTSIWWRLWIFYFEEFYFYMNRTISFHFFYRQLRAIFLHSVKDFTLFISIKDCIFTCEFSVTTCFTRLFIGLIVLLSQNVKRAEWFHQIFQLCYETFCHFSMKRSFKSLLSYSPPPLSCILSFCYVF